MTQVKRKARRVAGGAHGFQSRQVPVVLVLLGVLVPAAYERKSFIVPEGFEVNLYASDPQIAKPIQMNFDAQGRLWIASSSVYPQIKPGQVANDKILIVEDRDGDGRADEESR